MGKKLAFYKYCSYICSVIQKVTGADSYRSARMTRKGS